MSISAALSWVVGLRAASTATTVAESAEQQDYDDDEQDREHGSPPEPRLGWFAHLYVRFIPSGMSNSGDSARERLAIESMRASS